MDKLEAAACRIQMPAWYGCNNWVCYYLV